MLTEMGAEAEWRPDELFTGKVDPWVELWFGGLSKTEQTEVKNAAITEDFAHGFVYQGLGSFAILSIKFPPATDMTQELIKDKTLSKFKDHVAEVKVTVPGDEKVAFQTAWMDLMQKKHEEAGKPGQFVPGQDGADETPWSTAKETPDKGLAWRATAWWNAYVAPEL
eukprot:TRINITY_DN106888_c0_g1_i1.p3 TRINITY_DN106888_c0_g1~~TRINITY_DN106888_c0_g1_i1.p3  ORF type:complete len:196 (+),score=33.79 TRINITY_DN106888_c0_g1_i1:88-588(+)